MACDSHENSVSVPLSELSNAYWSPRTGAASAPSTRIRTLHQPASAAGTPSQVDSELKVMWNVAVSPLGTMSVVDASGTASNVVALDSLPVVVKSVLNASVVPLPGGPGGPVGPTDPAAPVAPVGPAGPRAPRGPRGI